MNDIEWHKKLAEEAKKLKKEQECERALEEWCVYG